MEETNYCSQMRGNLTKRFPVVETPSIAWVVRTGIVGYFDVVMMAVRYGECGRNVRSGELIVITRRI